MTPPPRHCIVCVRNLDAPVGKGRPTTVCSPKCLHARKIIQREQSRQRAIKRGCPPSKHGTSTGYTMYRCDCPKCMAWSRNYKTAQRTKQKEAAASMNHP